jgi:DNA-binding response OmpR family regulator
MRTYEQILENVWGWEYRDSPDYVHVYISNLRKKIEPDSRNPIYLETQRGIGYRFAKQKE